MLLSLPKTLSRLLFTFLCLGGVAFAGSPTQLAVPTVQAAPATTYATSIGTAWPLASGHVVTNHHVVHGRSEVFLITDTGAELRAWPVILDEVNDLAFLEVEDPAALPSALPLAPGAVGVGTEVFTVGFPRADAVGIAPTVSMGAIQSVQGVSGNPICYQTSVPVQPGNSGGPLLNMSGEVVGVVTAMLALQEPTTGAIQLLENASSALKVEGVHELLPLLPGAGDRIRALPEGSGNIEGVASRVEGSILMVVAN